MSLAAKRALKDFQDNDFPKLKKELDAAAGFDVPLEVDWEKLSSEAEYASSFKEGFTNIYFKTVIDSFKSICADDLGRDSLKKILKKVQFTNSGQFYSERGFSFENGVLKIDHQLTNVGADWTINRVQSLIPMLEKAL